MLQEDPQETPKQGLAAGGGDRCQGSIALKEPGLEEGCGKPFMWESSPDMKTEL